MLVTVFTPSYNRAHTIKRVYDSLLSQTIQDFEWIIVDDGSKDDTASVVESWINENRLHITFIQQQNKGKFKTLVDVIHRAKGDWFLIADSDDAFEPETISTFMAAYDAVPEENKPKIAGVTCLVIDSVSREVVGKPFNLPSGCDSIVKSVNEVIYKDGITGEKWGILKTCVLKEFADRIPIPEDVKYIGEQALWSPIGDKYLTVFINAPLRIYYQGTSDTLSSRNIAGRYPLGAWITERIVLPSFYKYFKYQPRMVIFSVVKLNYASFLAKKSFKETVKGFPFVLKSMILFARPIGWLASIKYPKK